MYDSNLHVWTLKILKFKVLLNLEIWALAWFIDVNFGVEHGSMIKGGESLYMNNYMYAY